MRCMDKISFVHHKETMGDHCWSVFMGESSLEDCLGGCRMLSIHSTGVSVNIGDPVVGWVCEGHHKETTYLDGSPILRNTAGD